MGTCRSEYWNLEVHSGTCGNPWFSCYTCILELQICLIRLWIDSTPRTRSVEAQYWTYHYKWEYLDIQVTIWAHTFATSLKLCNVQSNQPCCQLAEWHASVIISMLIDWPMGIGVLCEMQLAPPVCSLQWLLDSKRQMIPPVIFCFSQYPFNDSTPPLPLSSTCQEITLKRQLIVRLKLV
jgi:hypothetical protein